MIDAVLEYQVEGSYIRRTYSFPVLPRVGEYIDLRHPGYELYKWTVKKVTHRPAAPPVLELA